MASLASMEGEVNDGTNRVIRNYVDPWLHFGSKGVDVPRVDGRRISFSGLAYEGSPQTAFWDAGYIDRHVITFIDDIVTAVVGDAREKGYDTGVALADLKGMLRGAIHKIFDRMAVVDQRLRGRGFPGNLSKRSVQSRVELLWEALAQRIDAEFALERVQARTIMIQSGAKASALVDSFSTWLMAGVSAFTLFLVANHEKVKGLLPDAVMWWGLVSLVCVLTLGLLQKAAGVIVASAAAGDLVGRDLANRGEVAAGFSIISQELLRGVLRPFRSYVQRSLNRTASGDLAHQGRVVLKLAQCQSVAMVLQLGIVLLMVIAASWTTLSPHSRAGTARATTPASTAARESEPSRTELTLDKERPVSTPGPHQVPEKLPHKQRDVNGSTEALRKNERT